MSRTGSRPNRLGSVSFASLMMRPTAASQIIRRGAQGFGPGAVVEVGGVAASLLTHSHSKLARGGDIIVG